MAYSADGLNLVGGSKAGNSPQVWSYKTNDIITAVDGSGYFNSAASVLKVGDLMYVHANAAGTVPTFGFVIVTSNTGSVVDVTNATALGTIDSD
jgi:hypothetical protein